MRPQRASFIPGATAWHCEVEGRGHIDRKDAVPIRHRYLFQRTPHLAQHTASVVDENVDTPRRLCRLGHEGAHRILIGDINAARVDRSWRAGGEALCLRKFVEQQIAAPHVRAALGKRQRYRPPKPMRRPGDNHGLVCEFDDHNVL
ncbi:MAG: hypothetical protein R2873_04495 [Caldilineaceae bacterium]